MDNATLSGGEATGTASALTVTAFRLPPAEFFPAPAYHARLQDALAHAGRDPHVVGALLIGSLARGDAHAGADMDLFVLLKAGTHRPFFFETRDGIVTEIHAGDRAQTIAKIRARPSLAYGFRDAVILRDTDAGDLAAIQEVARQTLDAYRTPPDERAGIAYWLRSARVKIAASDAAHDALRAGFVTATTSWKILEGVFAVNDLPVPPSGALLSCLAGLERTPPDFAGCIERLFTDRDSSERNRAALWLIDWVTGRLDAAAQTADTF